MTNEELIGVLVGTVGEEDEEAFNAAKAAVLARMGPPPGWKLVPVQPTDEMWAALEPNVRPRGGINLYAVKMKQAWATMLDAAPITPSDAALARMATGEDAQRAAFMAGCKWEREMAATP